MKHRNGALILGLVAWAGVCSATGQIAVVDFERIVKLHPNTAGDRKAIEEVYNTFKSAGDAKAAQVSEAVKAFEAAAKEVQSPVLSESARKKAEAEAKRKYDAAKVESDELKQLEDLHRMQLNERERMLLKRTTEAIRAVVKKIADEKKITLVLPTAPVLYYDETLDLTADVLRALGVDPATPDPDEAAPAKEKAPAKEADPAKKDPAPR
jgi:Skp family chaperone for outer membrane proteins